jgi:hypothetical protein
VVLEHQIFAFARTAHRQYNPCGDRTPMKRIRIYADTSVIGGCLDEEFSETSRGLLAAVSAGRFALLLSDLLAMELERAPTEVQSVLTELPTEAFERVESNDESVRLRDAYLRDGVVTRKTCSRCPPHRISHRVPRRRGSQLELQAHCTLG